jgi:Tfp pilus assembly protein PilN
VRAVNLLPEKHRPRQPTGGRKGSSYFVLGALGLVLVGVLVYVLTLNSINSARSEVAQAQAETQRLQGEAQQLGPYGDFAKIKQQRVASVKDLAQGRFDWELLVRELAHVLPSDVWLTQADAADNPSDAMATGSGAPGATSPGATSGSSSSSPVMGIQGCASSQSEVAVTLVRMRELDGVSDVELTHSTRGSDQSTTGSSGSGSGPTSSGDCGTTHGQPNYSFQLNVTFDRQATDSNPQPGAVPTSLGGGQ